MELPKLYKKSKTGSIHLYSIKIIGQSIETTYGKIGGKMQKEVDLIYSGKNIGKLNETTPKEQAVAEAKSRWNKKVKSGYVEDPSGEVIVNLPPRVGVWDKKYYKDGLISTIKYNGVNGTFRLEIGVLKLYSRSGSLLPSIPHLEDEVVDYMMSIGTNELNGELYIHGEHLQDIASAVKKPKELSKKLKFVVFDYPSSTYPNFEQRLLKLSSCFSREYKYVLFSEGQRITSYEDIDLYMKIALKNGFEGLVIKDKDAPFVHNERSNMMWKYKIAKDEEFRVIGYELDELGHVVYICESNVSELYFKVKRKGTNEERLLDAVSAKKNMYKWLRVEYEMLSKDGKPLKPVGLEFIEMQDAGKPIL